MLLVLPAASLLSSKAHVMVHVGQLEVNAFDLFQLHYFSQAGVKAVPPAAVGFPVVTIHHGFVTRHQQIVI